MRLIQLEIKQFGKLESLILEPGAGLNIYRQPNESGKTTLIYFIYFMFYGYEARLLKSYFPWKGGPLVGTLTFEEKGRQWRIERVHPVKGAAKRKVFCLDTGEEKMLAAREQPGPLFLHLDGETFLKTFCITQGNLLFARTDGLDTALKNLAATGDENASFERAEAILNRQHTQYMHRGRAQGKLLELQQELEKNRRALQLIRREIDAKIDQKREWERLQAGLEEVDRAYQALEAQREAAEKSDALRLLEQITALERLKDPASEKPQVSKEALGTLDHAFVEEAETKKNAVLAAEEKGNAEDRLQLLRENRAAFGFHAGTEQEIALLQRGWKRGWIYCGIALLCAGGAGVAAGLLLHPLFYLAAGILAAEGCALLLGRQGSRARLCRAYGVFNGRQLLEKWARYQDLGSREQALAAAWEQACAREADAKRAAQNAQAQLAALQAQYRILTPQELERERIRWEIYENRSGQARAEQQIQALLGAKNRAQVEALAQGAVLLPETAEQIDQALRETEALRAHMREQMEALDIRGLKQLWQQQEALERRIRVQQETAESWQKSLNAVIKTMSWLKSANEEMNTQFAPKLCALAADALSRLTGGKYSELLLNDRFEIRLRTAEGTFPVDAFSAGTKDAVYFAFRLAVSALLSETALPLVLDDPFVNLDPARYKQAVWLLETAAKERQILYFTCHS